MAGDTWKILNLPHKFTMVLALSLVCVSQVSAQIGFNGLYSISRNIYGISMYTYSDSKKHIGLYFEVKGVMSDPRKKQNRETFGIASAGLTRQIGDKIITYLGGGYSIRFYLDGNFDRLDQPKFNLTGGVIATNLGSTPLLNHLSYQIGVDTQPFGLNIGVGLRITLPRKFLK